jgi:hypothetical protein
MWQWASLTLTGDAPLPPGVCSHHHVRPFVLRGGSLANPKASFSTRISTSPSSGLRQIRRSPAPHGTRGQPGSWCLGRSMTGWARRWRISVGRAPISRPASFRAFPQKSSTLTAQAIPLTAQAIPLPAQANFRREPMEPLERTGQHDAGSGQTRPHADRAAQENNPTPYWSQRVRRGDQPDLVSSIPSREPDRGCRGPSRPVRDRDKPNTIRDGPAPLGSQWNRFPAQPSTRPQQARPLTRQARSVREPMVSRTRPTKPIREAGQTRMGTHETADVADQDADVQDQTPTHTT